MKKIAKTILKRTIWVGRGTATVMGLAMLLAVTVGLASTALAGTGIGKRFDLGKVNVVNNATTTLRGNGSGELGLGALLEVKREGNGFGPALRVENASTSITGGTGITMQVPAGERPMVVNTSAGTAFGLSADELDGKDSSSFASGVNGKAVNADLLDGTDLSGLASGTNGKANDADRLDGKDSTSFANGTNGKANDADLLDGKDSTAFVDPTKIYEVQDSRTGSGGNSIAARFAKCDPGDRVLSGGGVSGDPIGDTLVSSLRDSTNGWAVVYRDGGGGNVNISAIAYCADLPPLR